MPIIFALLSGFFAGLVAIFAKLGFENNKIDSTVATTIRSLIMFIFLAGVTLIAGKFKNFEYRDLTGKDWLFIILSGIAGALSWIFYFVALQQGKSITVVSLDKLSIIFTAIFAYFLLSESIGWREIIGIVFMVGGAILISLK